MEAIYVGVPFIIKGMHNLMQIDLQVSNQF